MIKLDIFPNSEYKAMCYDSDYTIYYSHQKRFVSSFNIYSIKSKVIGEKLTKSQRKREKEKLIHHHAEMVIHSNCFEDSNEIVMDLRVMEEIFDFKYLLIVTNRSLYTKKLDSKKDETSNLATINPMSKLRKIESISGYLRKNFKIEDFKIKDVQMDNSEIYLKIGDLSFEDANDNSPTLIILKYSFEDREKKTSQNLKTLRAISAIDQDDDSDDESKPRLCEKWYLPLYHGEDEEFWAAHTQHDQIYFSKKKKVYSAKLFLDAEDDDGPKDFSMGKCKLVYSNKFGIRFLDFSLSGKLAVCSDKEDRIIILKTENKWEKIGSFHINFGKIKNVILSGKKDLVFV